MQEADKSFSPDSFDQEAALPDISPEELQALEGVIDDLNTRALLHELWEELAKNIRGFERILQSKREISLQMAEAVSGLFSDTSNQQLRESFERLNSEHMQADQRLMKKIRKLVSLLELVASLFKELRIHSRLTNEVDFFSSLLRTYSRVVSMSLKTCSLASSALKNWSEKSFRKYLHRLKESILAESSLALGSIDVRHVRRMRQAYRALHDEIVTFRDKQKAMSSLEFFSKHGFHAAWKRLNQKNAPVHTVLRPYIFSAIFMIMIYQGIEYLLLHHLEMKRINAGIMEL